MKIFECSPDIDTSSGRRLNPSSVHGSSCQSSSKKSCRSFPASGFVCCKLIRRSAGQRLLRSTWKKEAKQQVVGVREEAVRLWFVRRVAPVRTLGSHQRSACPPGTRREALILGPPICLYMDGPGKPRTLSERNTC